MSDIEDQSDASDKCEHGIPRRHCTAVHQSSAFDQRSPPLWQSTKCLVADCPETTADGQAMCAEHIKRIEP